MDYSKVSPTSKHVRSKTVAKGVRVDISKISTLGNSSNNLPNGNTLSLDTDKGRIFEITPQGEIVWEFINPRGGFYRTQRISYEDCPEADPYYMETDGHMDATPVDSRIPDNLGLPVKGTPDYCPRFPDQS